jgi:hypothetical protein
MDLDKIMVKKIDLNLSSAQTNLPTLKWVKEDEMCTVVVTLAFGYVILSIIVAIINPDR